MFFDLQCANMLKRVSALILDIIVLAILATGSCTLVSWVIGYDAQYEKLNSISESYSERYGVRLEIDNEEYLAMPLEKQQQYDKAREAIEADSEFGIVYSSVMSMTVTIMSIGILLAYVIAEFVVPLILKDGQTVGKKIFGICLMQTDHTRIRTTSLFVRTFLGKFTIETMIPTLTVYLIFVGYLGFTGTLIILLLITLQVIAISVTKTNSAIHDLLGSTVAVDAKSQKIFKDLAELEEYKKTLG